MRKTAKIILEVTATVLLIGSAVVSMPAAAGGQAPSPAVCSDKANPPTDPAVIGGCIAMDRKKGNCIACHVIEGGALPGNIGPALANVGQRFPDRAKLRAQIWDATVANPRTSMPPFGRNKILTEKEIDEVVDFLQTL